MSLTVKEPEGGKFEQVPEGVFIARCYQLLDLGTQTVYIEGEEKQVAKIAVGWELLDDEVRREDGAPFTIEKNYTASLWKTSGLAKDLVAWRGKAFTDEELKGFDLKKILDAYCQIQVAHKKVGDKTYANIAAIMGMPKGMPKPEPVNDVIAFDIDEPDIAVFNSLRDYYKLKIQSAPEWKAKESDLVKQGAMLATASTQVAANPKSEDVVITDLDEPVNLDELPEPEYDGITDAQVKKIHAVLNSKGVKNSIDRERAALAITKSNLDHDVADLKGLSKAWAIDLIGELEKISSDALVLFFQTPDSADQSVANSAVKEEVPF